MSNEKTAVIAGSTVGMRACSSRAWPGPIRTSATARLIPRAPRGPCWSRSKRRNSKVRTPARGFVASGQQVAAALLNHSVSRRCCEAFKRGLSSFPPLLLNWQL